MTIGSNVCEFAIPSLRQIFVALRFFQGVEQARRSQGDLVKSVFKMRFTQTKLKFKSVVCREALVPLTIQARHHKAAVVGGVCRIGRNRLLNTIDGLVFSQINTPRTAVLRIHHEGHQDERFALFTAPHQSGIGIHTLAVSQAHVMTFALRRQSGHAAFRIDVSIGQRCDVFRTP